MDRRTGCGWIHARRKPRRNMLTELMQQLKGDEGYNPKPYKDTRGILTGGYGTNLEEIDQEDWEYLLRSRATRGIQQLLEALPWVSWLDDVRQGVLANMAYNLGVSGLLEFRQMLAAMQANNWNEAAAQMESSEWAKQVPARAQRLILQMRTGVWQYSQ